jgi:hypothetical protein
VQPAYRLDDAFLHRVADRWIVWHPLTSTSEIDEFLNDPHGPRGPRVPSAACAGQLIGSWFSGVRARFVTAVAEHGNIFSAYWTSDGIVAWDGATWSRHPRHPWPTPSVPRR